MSPSEIAKAINSFSPSQLATVKQAVAMRDAALQTLAEQYRTEGDKALARMTELARLAGTSLASSVATPIASPPAPLRPQNGDHRVRKAKSKVKRGKPLYRNPTNHRQTWTGKGPAPQWMAGKPRETFLIAPRA